MQIGKYRLIHKLATGGMAEVFLAKAAGPMGFEKLLVLKRILPHLATEPAFVEMFLTEARLAAQLNHPNIVQIFDFGEADGTYFLAMEYIDGPNLREIIKRSNAVGLSLPLAFCARVVSAACEGLAFAHGFRDPVTLQPMDIIHRDISPDNILLSRQGAVKVVDFGIAKAAGMSPHTQTGVLKGKLAYMPPEQLRNEPLDRRADVYALGVVLYELLTGSKPFFATSDAGMVQAVLFEQQVSAVQRRPDVPEALQRVLARALAKERERRYPDCASFQAELEEYLVATGKPIGAPQISQLVAMMTVGAEPPSPAVPSISSSPGNPRSVASLPSSPLEPPVPHSTSIPPSVPQAQPLTPSATDGASRGEVTAVARPSKIILQHVAQRSQGAELAVIPPPSVPLPAAFAPSERDRVWIARLGVLLILAGAGGLLFRATGETRVDEHNVPDTPAQTPLKVLVSDGGAGGVSPLDGGLDAGVQPPPGHGHEDGGVKAPPHVEVSGGDGILDLRVVPGAELYLDGFQIGRARGKPFPLDAGHHTLRIVNTELRKDILRKVTIVAGETTHLDVNLQEAE